MDKFIWTFLLAGWIGVLRGAQAVATPPGTYLGEELGRMGEAGGGAAMTPPSLLPTLLNIAFSLALVVGLIYLAYWLLLRWRERQGLGSGGERVGLIRLLERQYLDGKHAVAVVEVGDKILTLGLGDQVTLLDQESDPAQVEKLRQMAPLPSEFMSFKEQLQRVGQRLRREEWSKAKQALRTQAEELEEQIRKLKGRQGGGA